MVEWLRLASFRRRALAGLCGALFAGAAWTSSGVLAVDTLPGSARLVGLLPSFASLALAMAIGAPMALWARAAGVPPGLLVVPLAGSIAWTTTATAPALLAWAGPSAILPFALSAVGVFIALISNRRDSARAYFARCLDGRWSSRLAAAVTACWLITLLASASLLPLTGDEPRYLLVTQSILTDGDVELTNNYDEETYRTFYPGPLERHVTMGYLAEQYSFHGLGLSFLLIPGFVLGGVLGSRLLIVLVAAAGAGLFWSAARRVTDSAPAAWLAWLAMISAAPFALHGILLYPDGVAAAITSAALWVLVRLTMGDNLRALAVVAGGLALATLPWLHIRLSLTAGIFGLAILWALSRRQRDLILPFLAAPIISFVLWIASTWVMFHKLDPTAAFREKAAGDLAQAPLGTLGLLFDAEYGLLTYAPVLGLAALGGAALWKRSRAVAVVGIVLTLGTLVLAASWIWWGGDSAPARFLVPVLPLIALGFASWLVGTTGPARAFATVLIVIGATVTVCLALVDGGAYIVSAADGRATIWEWLSPNVDLSLALPSLFRPGARPVEEARIAASWILTGVLAFSVMSWRHAAMGLAASWVRASAVAVVWLTLGASVAWWQRDAPPWTPDRGQLRMLHAATSPTLSVGVHSRGWHDENPRARAHFTTRASAVSSLVLATPSRMPPQTRLHVPFVPAGRYTIEVEPPVAPALPPPRLTLELGREASPFTTWLATPGAAGPAFSLAVPIWSVRVVSDSPRGASTIVRLRPQSVLAPPPHVNGFALRGTSFGSLVAYSMDPYSAPASNGLGLTADRQGTLMVASSEGRPVPFTLHVRSEAAGATVSVEHGAFRRSIPLRPHASEQIAIAGALETLVPLRVATSGGSWVQDGRRLGAIVHVSP